MKSTSSIHWSDTKEHLSHAGQCRALGHSRDRPPSLSLGAHKVGWKHRDGGSDTPPQLPLLGSAGGQGRLKEGALKAPWGMARKAPKEEK